MLPVLLEMPPFTLYAYGTLVAAGLLVGWWYARLCAERIGLDGERIWVMGLYASVAGLIGARIWLRLAQLGASGPAAAAAPNVHAGGAFYGGLFGALIAIALYTRRNRMPLRLVMDGCAPGLALGHAIGRLGCLAAGCCYGKPTTLPWGIVFSSERAAQLSGTPLHVALHPTQLYDGAAELLNCVVLTRLLRRERFAGQTAGAYLVLYGLERAMIEFVRGDPGRTLLLHGSVSLMQLVSVSLLGAGALLWWRRGAPGVAARTAANSGVTPGP